MRHSTLIAFISLILFALLWPSRSIIAAEVNPHQVNDAIERAVKWLYSAQANGDWEGRGQGERGAEQRGGRTALATYALLAAGESRENARIKQGVDYLVKNPIIGTYALGLRAQVWQYLSQSNDVRQAIARDGKQLMAHVRTGGDGLGLFRYTQQGDDYDHSCSNYGVLGLWAIAQTNFELPTALWQTMDTAWRNHQNADGSWSYTGRASGGKGGGTMSMTSAAVATLFITQEYIHYNQGIQCTGNIVDENIERGLHWMSANFHRFDDGRWPYYALYNIERVGVAGGRKYFGTTDWYAEGAAWLLSRQKGNGSWDGNVPHTCWAVLFLVRGRAPVMMNKLDYTVDFAGDKPRPATWNERPRDVANITRWTSKQIERDLNWQIVNLKVDVSELHDAPILYISGKEAIRLAAGEEAKLRQFVQEGGLIVGNADCSAVPFSESFKKLGTKLFPPGEFRELPEDHPIYTQQQFHRSKWQTRPGVQGLSNGVRELMLLLGGDPGKGWQVQAFAGAQRGPWSELAADIFLYTVSRQDLRYKGDSYIIRPPSGTPARSVQIARLQYPGNWDPEPGGWRRLDNFLRQHQKTALQTTVLTLGQGKLDRTCALAHLTGTAKFTLSDAARDELRKYVEGGGVLVVNTAGGVADFRAAAEAAICKTFSVSSAEINPLPADHAIYKAAWKIEQVAYRTAANKVLGGSIHTPRLRGLTVNGRTAIIYSEEDLSAGLVGNPVDGIIGYSPAAATVGDKSRAARARSWAISFSTPRDNLPAPLRGPRSPSRPNNHPIATGNRPIGVRRFIAALFCDAGESIKKEQDRRWFFDAARASKNKAGTSSRTPKDHLTSLAILDSSSNAAPLVGMSISNTSAMTRCQPCRK